MSKTSPLLRCVKEAGEAARFYASIFPDSRVVSVNTMPTDSPSGPAGSAAIVDFKRSVSASWR